MSKVLRITLVIIIGLLAAAPMAGAAAAQPEQAIVQDVNLSNFPQVGLEVVVPASLIKNGKPVFSVEENGRRTEVLKASVKQVEQPIDAVLVLDTSGSMKGAALDAAKSAANAFIAELKPPSRAALVVFSDKARVVVPTTADTGALSKAVAGIQAGGETALYDAVLLGMRQVAKGGDAQPVVIVLSDGGDTASRAPLKSALAEVRKAGVPVLAVALPSKEADAGSLKVLAQANGGRVSSVSDLASLKAYYTGLAQELQTRYSVVFNSNRPATMDLDIAATATSGDQKAVGGVVVKNPMAAYNGPLTQTMEPVPPADIVTYAFAVTLVFASVALLVGALALLLVRPTTGLDQLAYYDQVVADGAAGGGVEADRVMGGVIGAVDFVAGKGGFKRLAYEELDRAGLPLRPTEYIGMHVALVIVAGLVSGLLFQSFWVSLLVVVVATIVPIWYLSHRVRSRRLQFEAQLPDTLDLLAGSLRAGWGLQQALEAVVDQSKPPISDEFRRAQTEVRLGRSVEESLESVARRIQSVDFDWVVSAISIQREVGGNLAELLTIVANTIRERGALKRQIDALTSEGRLSAGILLVLPFFEAAVLFIMNPAYISLLFTTVPGYIMLFMGFLMMLVGTIWMTRVTRVEV